MTASIILFAHGARDPEWANPMRRVRAAMLAQQPERLVELAFLEFLSPDLPASVSALVAQGAKKIVVVPMFIAQGGHLKRDLPEMLDQLRSTWPDIQFSLRRAIGEDDLVIQAMASATLHSAELPAD